MGTLAAALAWAARGFPVFPLRENTKEPAFGGDWTEMATTDQATIARWWVDPVLGTERDYNIGCKCNDYVVVDGDVKNGKDGYNQYKQLGGHFNTLVVRTPTGGFHSYFYGPESNNAPLSDAVDIRSHNGYVVAPGSSINGLPYVIENDRDIEWVPNTIERMLSPPYVRNALQDTNVVIDSAAAVDAGRRFVESAPVAVQGDRGDDTTFQTAARLIRELAVSIPTTFRLMRDHWNDRCLPPWSHEELWIKVNNAASYGTADTGKLSAEVLFGNVQDLIPPPSIFEQTGVGFGNAILPCNIGPRRWLLDRLLMTGAVTLLLAAGAAGKSSISLAVAAHLAIGRDFAGCKAKRGCKTIIYNGEDDITEQSRRLLALCIAYGFEYEDVKKNIMLLSPRELKMTLVAKEFGRAVRNDEMVRQLTNLASDPDVGLLILDPLVRVHACDESDNVQMDVVMDTITDIAYGADVAVMVLHHVNKATGSESRAGNMDIARGASSVVNAARIAFTLIGASEIDAQEYGMHEDERMRWVRMDDAKMNMSLANYRPTWFKKLGVAIEPSLEVVGVLQAEELEKSKTHLRVLFGEVIVQLLEANNAASMPMATVVARIKEDATTSSMAHTMSDTELKQKLEGTFSSPVHVRGMPLLCERSQNGKPAIFKFV